MVFGKRDFPRPGPVHVVAHDPAAHVVEVVRVDRAVDDLVAGQQVVGLGDHLAPVCGIGVGIAQIDRDHPVPGRVEVGEQLDLVVHEAGAKTRRGAHADRLRPRAGLQVVQVHVRARPAVLHRVHHVAAVAALRGVDERLGPVPLAEEFGVVRDIGAEGMMAHPGTDFPRPPGVVEAAALRVEKGRPVQEVRQPVRQVLAGGEVADPDLHFVLPSVANGVHEQVAVRREVADAHAGGAVGMDVERVDHDLEVAAGVDRVALGLLGRGTPVDGAHLAFRPAEAEVLEVAGPAGEDRSRSAHELAQA